MKIGVLTLPLEANYGGILQAWALQNILKDRGHNVETFQRVETRWHNPVLMPFIWMMRFIRKCMGRKDIVVLAEKHYRELKQKRAGNIEVFKTAKLNLFPTKAIADLPIDVYDMIIVGSDQIWRKPFFETLWNKDVITDAFLNSFKDSTVIKIAYAASFGLNEWQFNQKETQTIAEALKRFDAISVREFSGVNLLKDVCGLDACNVCDPTLLLSADDYISRLNLKLRSNQGLVSYILDHNDFSNALVSQFVHEKKLPHFELHSIKEDGTIPSVEEWLTSIASADMVITDSFHGCMFSIIFRKPLAFICNKNRGNARFDTIIEAFGLENNLIDSNAKIDINKSFSLPADIDERVRSYRDKSLNFLESHLSPTD